MFLYKYRPVDKWTLTDLSEQTIHFKSPLYYNDPFDSRINLIAEGNDDDWRKMQKLDGYDNTELERFKELFKNEIDPAVLIKSSRLSCFSEVSDNILMWSHYADCHKGICLQFHTEELNPHLGILLNPNDFNNKIEVLKSNVAVLFKVKYSNKMPPPLNYLNFKNQELSHFILTKSLYWSYEKEWRIVATKPQLKSDNPRYLDNTLKGIIFGLNCSDADKNLVKSVIGNKKIELYQAKASKSEYKVDIIPLK